ncbi:hypothetical protein D3C76_1490930 [compost metagenome]
MKKSNCTDFPKNIIINSVIIADTDSFINITDFLLIPSIFISAVKILYIIKHINNLSINTVDNFAISIPTIPDISTKISGTLNILATPNIA